MYPMFILYPLRLILVMFSDIAWSSRVPLACYMQGTLSSYGIPCRLFQSGTGNYTSYTRMAM